MLKAAVGGVVNADRFRVDVLAPALRDDAPIVVDVSGVLDIDTSFLEAAFGALAQEFDREYLKKNLHISAPDNLVLEAEIWLAIDQAFERRQKERVHSDPDPLASINAASASIPASISPKSATSTRST